MNYTTRINWPRYWFYTNLLIGVAFLFGHIPKMLSGVIATVLIIVGLKCSTQAMYYLRNSGGSESQETNFSLLTEGPYKITRHPMYMGYLTIIAGVHVLNFSVYSLLALAVAIFTLNLIIKEEEKALITAFKSKYYYYRSHTRRFL